jgi:DNA repair exonuclease SbcCD ATPase subunit
MSDLVEQFRNVKEEDVYAHPWTFRIKCQEAADEIERLRARAEELERELNDWRNGDLRGVQAHMHSAMARAEAAEARVVELESALSDLLSWFPTEPSKPLWQLKAGEYGADEAVEAARAALTAALEKKDD